MNEPYNILFGNGEVPIHTSALKILKKAKTIICLDGGVDKLLDLGYSPNYILGDLDSLSLHPDNYNCDVIELHDQSKNDLDMATTIVELEEKITEVTQEIYGKLTEIKSNGG